MFCMNCGTKLPEGAKFCTNCGCRIGVVAEAPAPEQCSSYFEKRQRDFKVGDIIKLGEWHSESIEWQVLDVKEGKALLLSKYALACKQYHSSRCNITWENCDLRRWLNGDFFQKALKGDATKCVVESYVPAHYNPDYSTDPGNDTKDKVFTLSVKEVLKYFKTNAERICLALTFVINEGPDVDEKGACYWWLRSPGRNAYFAAGIDSDGSVYSDGRFVFSEYAVVRPACWVDLSKLN